MEEEGEDKDREKKRWRRKGKGAERKDNVKGNRWKRRRQNGKEAEEEKEEETVGVIGNVVVAVKAFPSGPLLMFHSLHLSYEDRGGIWLEGGGESWKKEEKEEEKPVSSSEG